MAPTGRGRAARLGDAGVTSSKAQPQNTAGFRTSQSSKKDKSQRACNAGGAQPGESRGKLLFKELSQEAPSGKGSPGEGHLPPRRTQDAVSSVLPRTGCQQAGKAVLQEG